MREVEKRIVFLKTEYYKKESEKKGISGTRFHIYGER